MTTLRHENQLNSLAHFYFNSPRNKIRSDDDFPYLCLHRYFRHQQMKKKGKFIQTEKGKTSRDFLFASTNFHYANFLGFSLLHLARGIAHNETVTSIYVSTVYLNESSQLEFEEKQLVNINCRLAQAAWKISFYQGFSLEMFGVKIVEVWKRNVSQCLLASHTEILTYAHNLALFNHIAFLSPSLSIIPRHILFRTNPAFPLQFNAIFRIRLNFFFCQHLVNKLDVAITGRSFFSRLANCSASLAPSLAVSIFGGFFVLTSWRCCFLFSKRQSF